MPTNDGTWIKENGQCVSCLEGREAGAKHRAEGEPGRERPRRGNAQIYLITPHQAQRCDNIIRSHFILSKKTLNYSIKLNKVYKNMYLCQII
jgi:hypothetical protein